MLRAFEDPVHHDEVYKTTQRIFKNSDCKLNLNRNTENKNKIRRLAFRRFIMGYPPRKKSDTSMGDSINWEWLVHVCAKSNKNAIIVSRDTDYGVTHNEKSYVNDCLETEFSDRVSRKKNIKLYDSLSVALKEMKVQISESEIAEERKIIERAEHRKRKRYLDSLDEDHLDLLGLFFGESYKSMPIDELQNALHYDEGPDRDVILGR